MTDYRRDDEGRILQSFDELMLRASKLNPVKNHALVEVLRKGARLAFDDLNLGTMAKRVTLTNAALKQAKARDQQTIEAFEGQLLTRLGEFCYGLWDFHVGDQVAVLTTGSLEPSTPPWLIEDVVLRGAGTILFAPPGQGKSYIGMLLAQSLNYGREELWGIANARRDVVLSNDSIDGHHAALYLNLERSQLSMESRLGNVNAALGLPRDAGMLMIHARGQTLENVMAGAQRTIAEHGCSLVVLDSLSRAGVGDLSSNEAANRAMDLLNNLHVAWLCLAHTPRDDESHTYGSVQFDAAADLAIRMYSEFQSGHPVSTLGIVLQITKTNDTGRGKTRLLQLDFVETGLHAAHHGSEVGFPDLMTRARD